MNRRNRRVRAAIFGSLCLLLPGAPGRAAAHCDTLDGPVVQAARRALESGEAGPVLMWVRAEDEPAVREVLRAARAARGLGDPAREVADRYFFETVVRVHRAGEGEPFDGLKPAGEIAPAIAAADGALAEGSAEALSRRLADSVAEAVRERFRRVLETKAHAEHGVEAGREFVAAYVAYIHFVEAVDGMVSGGDPHHASEPAAPVHAHQ